MSSLRVTVKPDGVRPFLVDAVRAGGGVVVEPSDADALVWTASDRAHELRAIVTDNARIEWIQLSWAGVEPFLDVLRSARDRTWTAGQGVYAEPVAEHALALTLAGLRELQRRARATSWDRPHGDDRGGLSLLDARVTIVGAGGIAQNLIALLRPFRAHITVVRRRNGNVDGAHRTIATRDIIEALQDADVVVLACALTEDTRHLIARDQLAAMKNTAWLVNVARGGLVDTDALLAALDQNLIGGAALDVTEPEPLPPHHRLFSHPRALITPHVGNTPEMAIPLLTNRIRENVRRKIANEPLLGVVDVAAGY